MGLFNIEKWLRTGNPIENRSVKIEITQSGGIKAYALIITPGRHISPCYGYSMHTVDAALSHLEEIILKKIPDDIPIHDIRLERNPQD